MPLRRLTMPSAMRVLGLLASVRALQFTPKARPSLKVFSSAETELTIDPIAVTTEGEYSANEMAPTSRWKKRKDSAPSTPRTWTSSPTSIPD